MAHTIIGDERGIRFHVRVVFRGEGYGLVRDDGTHACKHDEDEPLVEFYDARYPHSPVDETKRGQFVSRYNYSILREGYPRGTAVRGRGLCLWGTSADWSIDGIALAEAIGYAAGVIEARKAAKPRGTEGIMMPATMMPATTTTAAGSDLAMPEGLTERGG